MTSLCLKGTHAANISEKYISMEITVINNEKSLNLPFNSSNFENILVDKKLPVVKDLQFKNDNSSFDLLINTGMYYSLIVNKNCTECKWAAKKYQNKKFKNSDLAQVFSFGKLHGYNDFDNVEFSSLNFTTYISFFSASSQDYMNTKAEFSGLLGFGSFNNETYNISIINKVFHGMSFEKKIVAIEYLKDKPNSGWLHLGGLPEKYSNNVTSCKHNYLQEETTQFYWSCKLNYILIGDEYDFYLAKDVDQFVIFDTLSYFHIIPYDLLDYFLKTNFNNNLNCTVNSLNVNESLFRLECYDILGPPKIKALHVVLNGWAYRLGSQSLFDREDIINKTMTKNNTYYYRVLFSKNKKGWTIGNTFFDKFILGFNFTDTESRVLFYAFNKTNIYNFTLYTNEDSLSEDGLLMFTLVAIGLCIFFFLFFMYMIFQLKTRKILKIYLAELENNKTINQSILGNQLESIKK